MYRANSTLPTAPNRHSSDIKQRSGKDVQLRIPAGRQSGRWSRFPGSPFPYNIVQPCHMARSVGQLIVNTIDRVADRFLRF
jgi:hypothetical protein